MLVEILGCYSHGWCCAHAGSDAVEQREGKI
jgi:hypothetical protein